MKARFTLGEDMTFSPFFDQNLLLTTPEPTGQTVTASVAVGALHAKPARNALPLEACLVLPARGRRRPLTLVAELNTVLTGADGRPVNADAPVDVSCVHDIGGCALVNAGVACALVDVDEFLQ